MGPGLRRDDSVRVIAESLKTIHPERIQRWRFARKPVAVPGLSAFHDNVIMKRKIVPRMALAAATRNKKPPS
jgi:hypothetical protein